MKTDSAQIQYDKMTKTPVNKLVLQLGLPTTVSMLVTSVYNMADTFFVSQLGTSVSGATGVVFALMAIINAFGFMFGHGAGSNISRKLGAHDVESARKFASTSFFLSLLCGALICILGFLFHAPFMRLLGSTDSILPHAIEYSTWILIAAPAMASSCVMNNILRYYGAASVYGSDIPIACVGIVSKVNMVFLAICIGISQGAQPIWGFNYGAKKYDRVRQAYRYSVTACTVIATIFFFCFQIFPHQIVGIFGTGSELYFQFAERYLKIFMFMTFANGIQPVSSGFFTSIGMAKLGIVMSLTRQVIFLLPLIIIFPLFMGIDGVMYAGPIADAAAFVLAIVFARRELGKMRSAEIV